MRALTGWLTATAIRIVATTREVPVNACYHYRGFRYGGYGHNLYEDYILAVARGVGPQQRRSAFANAVLTCRPRTMGEMLHIELGEVPLWDFPWARKLGHRISPVADPEQNPDPICHYCERGILASHINREIVWLEAAMHNLRKVGYLPERFGFITAVELDGTARKSYIVTDGNHRLAALHALGHTSARVKVSSLSRIQRSAASRWPGVVDGRYTVPLALAVFDRYFAETNPPLQELHPTRLIVDEAPLWIDSNSHDLAIQGRHS